MPYQRTMWSSRVAVTAALALASNIVAPVAGASGSEEACESADVEYAVQANLRIAGTMMGAGDGDHRVGPGRIVLRIGGRAGANPEGTSVALMAYELRQRFSIVSNVLFSKTTVRSDIEARAVPGDGGVIARGVLTGKALRWSAMPGRVVTEGSLLCEGAFCGSFGAPPQGTSAYRLGPTSIPLGTFAFSDDRSTFSMPSTLASKSSSPQQSSFLALSGREVRRSCAASSDSHR